MNSKTINYFQFLKELTRQFFSFHFMANYKLTGTSGRVGSKSSALGFV